MQPLQIALVLLSCFFTAELTAAMYSHSLSLMADAGHVFSDIAALGLTLLATWHAQHSRNKTVDQETTVSLSLSEILAAFVNGISLLGVALWIAMEAVGRMQSSQAEILGFPMLFAAMVGLGINGINALFLHSCSHHNLNLKSAFLHVLADIISSLGVMVAAVAVVWLHWTWADGLISLLVASLMMVFALPLLLQSLQLLWQNLRSQKVILEGLPLEKQNCFSLISLKGCEFKLPTFQDPCRCGTQHEPDEQRKQGEILLFPSLEQRIKS